LYMYHLSYSGNGTSKCGAFTSFGLPNVCARICNRFQLIVNVSLLFTAEK